MKGPVAEESEVSESAARLLRGMRTREAADRKRKEAARALEAELVAPLAPSSPPHSLERIEALKPRWVVDVDAPGGPDGIPAE